jgi:hypothetical protein
VKHEDGEEGGPTHLDKIVKKVVKFNKNMIKQRDAEFKEDNDLLA